VQVAKSSFYIIKQFKAAVAAQQAKSRSSYQPALRAHLLLLRLLLPCLQASPDLLLLSPAVLTELPAELPRHHAQLLGWLPQVHLTHHVPASDSRNSSNTHSHTE
jgi:hypothetical protein